MRQHLRDSGIVPLGDVPWGTHVCHFYESKDQMLEVLVPYFLAGLRSGECCVWICSEPLREDEALLALREALPQVDEFLASGQMLILPYDRWYLAEDHTFRAAEVLERWKTKLREAAAAGFAGLRVAGNTSWLDDGDWKAFADYENHLYSCAARLRMGRGRLRQALGKGMGIAIRPDISGDLCGG